MSTEHYDNVRQAIGKLGEKVRSMAEDACAGYSELAKLNYESKNIVELFLICEQLAEVGMVEAYEGLAYMYQHGIGTPINIKRAYAYCSVAVTHEVDHINKGRLAYLEGKLGDSLIEAQDLACEYYGKSIRVMGKYRVNKSKDELIKTENCD